MKSTRISIIGLIVMAVLALSAVAASSASAAELEALPGTGGFTVLSGASSFETVGGTKLTCTADKGKGELLGAKLDSSEVTFEKCKSSGVSCSSSGQSSGNIKTTIMSDLVWLNKSSKLAGQKLTLTAPVKITCLIISVEVTGSTLCPIEPVNKVVTKLLLGCNQSKGKQQYTTYLNEAGESFKAVTDTNGEESGLQSDELLDLEKAGEIMVT